MRIVIALFAALISSTTSSIAQPNFPPFNLFLAFTDPLFGIRIEAAARVRYNRARDYGGWQRMAEPLNRCFTTREQVLSDESTTPVRIRRTRSGWHCTIATGTWIDPYTAQNITNAKQMDIDHLVPLKEAHLSGGYLWPKEKRVEYANNRQNPDHLIAVSFSQNRRKGDRDPPRYMPPNPEYRCTYLRNWVTVKRQWDLSMDPREADFVREQLRDC
jgi:5-methylcytosine-specific restriction endonuclease McrA